MSVSTSPSTVGPAYLAGSDATAAQDATRRAAAATRRSHARSYAVVRLAATAIGASIAVAIVDGRAAVAVAFVALVVLFDSGACRRDGMLPLALNEVPSLALCTFTVTAILVVAGPLIGPTSAGSHVLSGPVCITLASVALITAARAAGYGWVRRLRRRGRDSEPTIVVGAGSVGTRLVILLRQHPEYGLRPVGFVDPAPPPAPRGRPVPILGGPADLPRLVAEHGIRRVIVAFSAVPEGELVGPLRACGRLDCEVYVVPRLFELGSSGAPDTEHVWGVPCVRLTRSPFRTLTWRVKRVIDVAVSATGLVALAPLLLLIALAVRLEVGPGILYRQERIGLDGRPFYLVKFRSLLPASEGISERWSVVADERMGRVGRFIRRTSLDELPQLWNILIGHMSLVGPRPERPHYIKIFTNSNHRYADRLRVPAGLTGLAQVQGLRGNTSIDERIIFDNYYIEHWSLWRDVKILVCTIWSVLLMKGA